MSFPVAGIPVSTDSWQLLLYPNGQKIGCIYPDFYKFVEVITGDGSSLLTITGSKVDCGGVPTLVNPGVYGSYCDDEFAKIVAFVLQKCSEKAASQKDSIGLQAIYLAFARELPARYANLRENLELAQKACEGLRKVCREVTEKLFEARKKLREFAAYVNGFVGYLVP